MSLNKFIRYRQAASDNSQVNSNNLIILNVVWTSKDINQLSAYTIEYLRFPHWYITVILLKEHCVNLTGKKNITLRKCKKKFTNLKWANCIIIN